MAPYMTTSIATALEVSTCEWEPSALPHTAEEFIPPLRLCETRLFPRGTIGGLEELLDA